MKTVVQNMLKQSRFYHVVFVLWMLEFGGKLRTLTAHMRELVTQTEHRAWPDEEERCQQPLRYTVSLVSCARVAFVPKTSIILDGSGNMLTGLRSKQAGSKQCLLKRTGLENRREVSDILISS